jgi:hypothetical protein
MHGPLPVSKFPCQECQILALLASVRVATRGLPTDNKALRRGGPMDLLGFGKAAMHGLLPTNKAAPILTLLGFGKAAMHGLPPANKALCLTLREFDKVLTHGLPPMGLVRCQARLIPTLRASDKVAMPGPLLDNRDQYKGNRVQDPLGFVRAATHGPPTNRGHRDRSMAAHQCP